jgi:cardiolipin synthase
MADQPAAAKAPTDQIRAVVEANRLELIESGVARLKELLAIIAKAEESLRLIFYIFDDDESGRLVRDALIEAAGAESASGYLSTASALRPPSPNSSSRSGTPAATIACSIRALEPSNLIRNHQKLVIADKKDGIIGGANVQDSYLIDEGPNHWRDLWLRIDGPMLEAPSRYFDSLFRWTKSEGRSSATCARS